MGKASNLKAALLKLEATYGTDPVPTAANDALFLGDIDVSPLEVMTVDRPFIRPFFGANRTLVAGKMMRAKVKLETAGFGTAGPASPTPAYDALLQSLGLARTVTAGTSVAYTPASSNLKSVTMYYYVDGLLHKMLGAVAESATLSFKRGQIPYYEVNLIGLYGGVTDTAIVAPTLTAYQVPYVVNKDNTTLENFLGTATGICLEELTINIANDAPYRNLVNCTESVAITGRKVTGSAVIEAVSVAAKDVWSLALSTNLTTIQLTHGLVTGNKVRFNSTVTDVDNPKYSSQDNVELLTLDLVFPPQVGNDDFTLTIL